MFCVNFKESFLKCMYEYISVFLYSKRNKYMGRSRSLYLFYNDYIFLKNKHNILMTIIQCMRCFLKKNVSKYCITNKKVNNLLCPCLEKFFVL